MHPPTQTAGSRRPQHNAGVHPWPAGGVQDGYAARFIRPVRMCLDAYQAACICASRAARSSANSSRRNSRSSALALATRAQTRGEMISTTPSAYNPRVVMLPFLLTCRTAPVFVDHATCMPPEASWGHRTRTKARFPIPLLYTTGRGCSEWGSLGRRQGRQALNGPADYPASPRTISMAALQEAPAHHRWLSTGKRPLYPCSFRTAQV